MAYKRLGSAGRRSGYDEIAFFPRPSHAAEHRKEPTATAAGENRINISGAQAAGNTSGGS